jgi:hypothetical protein
VQPNERECRQSIRPVGRGPAALQVRKIGGGWRTFYQPFCRILSKMADALFSSSWRIRGPYGGAQKIFRGKCPLGGPDDLTYFRLSAIGSELLTATVGFVASRIVFSIGEHSRFCSACCPVHSGGACPADELSFFALEIVKLVQ